MAPIGSIQEVYLVPRGEGLFPDHQNPASRYGAEPPLAHRYYTAGRWTPWRPGRGGDFLYRVQRGLVLAGGGEPIREGCLYVAQAADFDPIDTPLQWVEGLLAGADVDYAMWDGLGRIVIGVQTSKGQDRKAFSWLTV